MTDVLDAIATRVKIGDDCWEWTGAISPEGYGRLRDNEYAHRVMYELLVGPIPPKFTLDHLCRVRHCCRPDHLEPVTRGENVRRGMRLRTECRHGHPLDGMRGDGFRYCKTCARLRMRKKR